MFDLELTGKVAIVTGGSDGLGRAAALRLAAEGARVVICGRRAEHLRSAAETLSGETGGTVTAIPADVQDAGDCAALVDGAVEAFGGLDILVNNAGTSAASSLMDLDDEAWRADFELKVMAAVRLCRLAVPRMRARGGGAIVNASIGGGKAPPARQLPTSLSRAAGLNLTKALSAEFAPDNIRVNAICIGLIESAQWDRRAGGRPVEDLYAEMARRIPMGRVGRAAEYGDLVAFLCSARAAYVTGTAVNLDGGLCPVL